MFMGIDADFRGFLRDRASGGYAERPVLYGEPRV